MINIKNLSFIIIIHGMFYKNVISLEQPHPSCYEIRTPKDSNHPINGCYKKGFQVNENAYEETARYPVYFQNADDNIHLSLDSKENARWIIYGFNSTWYEQK